MIGFHDIIRIHNAVFGLNLGPLEYGLFWFHAIDGQAIHLSLAHSLVNKINQMCDAHKIDKIKNEEVLKFVMHKPHLLYQTEFGSGSPPRSPSGKASQYQPVKGRFYDTLDNFNDEQLRRMKYALYQGKGLDVERKDDHRCRDGKKPIEHHSKYDENGIEIKEKEELTLNRDMVRHIGVNDWDNNSTTSERSRKRQKENQDEWNKPATFRDDTNMIKQLASFILEEELHYDGDVAADSLIDAGKEYKPMRAEYGENIAKYCFHAQNTHATYQQRLALLNFAYTYNFAAVPETVDGTLDGHQYCQMPKDICWHAAQMFKDTSDIEKNPRFERIIDRYSQHENAEDGMRLWKRVTGLTRAYFLKDDSGNVVSEKATAKLDAGVEIIDQFKKQLEDLNKRQQEEINALEERYRKESEELEKKSEGELEKKSDGELE
jgi:hypothetical protein